MGDKKLDYSRYFRPIKEEEFKEWKPEPKSITTKLFEAFLESDHKMVEVKMEQFPEPKPKKTSKVKSTKQDSFASAFYAWKRKRKTKERLKNLGIDVLIIRRGEKVALKKREKKKG